jgi:hypothetical protein
MRRSKQTVLEGLDRWPVALREAWSDYQRHRQQMGCPLTEVAATRLRAKLERWGEDRALAALEWSMENGWRGVFEPPSSAAETAAQREPGFDLDGYIARHRSAGDGT